LNAFRYTSYAQEVIFGPGSLARLNEPIERGGWERIMLCTSGSLRRDGCVAAVKETLGDRLVAIYDRAQSHVPESQVVEAVALAEQGEVDALIGLGGGSPLGMAKAVSVALEERRGGKHGEHGGQARSSSPAAQPLLPIIAIPTTYAGSEMTPVYGVTRIVDGMPRKLTASDARITPKLVVYDPLLTLGLPASLTASTGINALAHCIEALYSVTRNPLSTAAAVGGIRVIMSALPRCYAARDDLEARTEMLAGAFLAGSALAHVSMALHHGLCHALGGTAGVPHGIANGIMLPHAMRFNLGATAPQLAQAAEAMGIALAGRSAEDAAEAAAQRVSDLVGDMNLPQRLRDAGVREADLPSLARLAFESRAVQSNPRPITGAAQIEGVLRAAW
jgi:maleylacetate reductase